MSEFSEGMAVGQSIGNNGGGGWGNSGWNDGWWILLLLLCGWGNNGWSGNGGGNQMVGYEIGRLATTNDVASGFSTSTIMSNQRDNQLAMQGGFASVQQTLCQGFSGINQSIADCCCQTQRSIDNVNYNLAKSTCDIIQAGNANTQRLLDYFNCEKISSLQAENAALTAQLSQNAQTNTIINTLRPVAQPAYITCSPYESAFGFNRSGYGYGNGGCCCGG